MKERRAGQASKPLAAARTRQQKRLKCSGRSSSGNPVQLLDSTGSPASGRPDPRAALSRSRILRNLAKAREERRHQAMPSLVPTTEVKKALQEGKSGRRVNKLPLTTQASRPPKRTAANSQAAGSVRQAHMRSWLESEEGKQWCRQKKQRFADAENRFEDSD